MNFDEIELKIAAAISRFYMANREIIDVDVGERTLCTQLAVLIDQEFMDHDVHVEYNRHGVMPKEIRLPDVDGVPTFARVSPDIVVHRPGHDENNLLVIEVKKFSNTEADFHDLHKLDLMKNQLAYRYALFLRLPTGPDATRDAVRSIWV